MTENDDFLIKNFFDEYGVGDIPDDGFSHRVRKALPRRYGVADRLLMLLSAIGIAVAVVAWAAEIPWADVLANIGTGIKYAISSVSFSMALLLKYLVAIIVVAWVIIAGLYQNQEYSLY